MGNVCCVPWVRRRCFHSVSEAGPPRRLRNRRGDEAGRVYHPRVEERDLRGVNGGRGSVVEM